MNSPIYFLSALLITYSFGPEETFVVHISDASNIDIILDTISSDVSTLSIFQTTISIDDAKIRNINIDDITFRGGHLLQGYDLNLSRFINAAIIHLGILCPMRSIILPNSKLEGVIFINMNLINPILPSIQFPKTLDYIILENTAFDNPFRFRHPYDHCSLIITLHCSMIPGGDVGAYNYPLGVEVLTDYCQSLEISEFSWWDLLHNDNNETDPSLYVNGSAGWWGIESEEFKQKHVPHNIFCVRDMSIYSQTFLDELICRSI